MHRIVSRSVLPVLVFVAACGGAEEEAPATETPAAEEAAPMEEMSSQPAVAIVSPADGSEVEGPDVTVELEATGVDIVSAGETMEGSGHHHIFLDVDVSPEGAPIPTVPNEVIHLGDGSASYTFEGVEPGEHRLITVVADGLHVPLQPWVVDTVSFTVR